MCNRNKVLRSFLILLVVVGGIVVIGGLVLWSLTTDRRTDVSTRVERKSLRFYKQGEEWFADVEHDKFGATYRVKRAKEGGSSFAWLCNVTHDVFGGEHPEDIYVHSIDVK